MKTIISWLVFIALALGLDAAPAQIGFWQNAAGGGGGGIAVVQNQANEGTGTTITVSISPTTGNRLVVLVATDSASFTVSDNQSTDYATGTTPTYSAFGNLLGQAVSAAVASGVTTVTVTPASSAYVQVFVYEVSGLTTGYTSGEYATNFFTGDPTWASGSFSTGTANSIVFYMGTANTGSNSTTFSTYTNGFASYGANSQYGFGASAIATATSYKIVSATGSQSTAVTPSASGNGITHIAAFN